MMQIVYHYITIRYLQDNRFIGEIPVEIGRISQIFEL